MPCSVLNFRWIWFSCVLASCLGAGALLWQSAQGELSPRERVGLFHLRSEQPLDDETGQAVLREMAQVRIDVDRRLGLPYNSRPLEANLFASRESFAAYASQHVSRVQDRTAIYVKDHDAGRVILYQHPDFLTDLRHECTHAVLHNAIPWLPLWLDEGLAEYFEVPGGERRHGHPHLTQTRARLKTGWVPSLENLENMHALEKMSGDDYQESWAWTHFLLNGPVSVRQVYDQFIMELQSGRPVGQLSDRLRGIEPEFETALIQHFENW